jgi:alkanesulfonate monooxygenase SsuD/methylene tetrahydromethanopterin reductase-like flavin-dependent oxidoreductase (luciferase family)
LCSEKFALLDEECRKIGRDPATMRKSAMVGFLVGANEAEFERRVRALLTMVGEEGTESSAWLEEHSQRWIVGTPDQAREMAVLFAASGAERVMLQDMLPRDHAMIELAARELIGQF